jgi:hypothetical protein
LLALVAVEDRSLLRLAWLGWPTGCLTGSLFFSLHDRLSLFFFSLFCMHVQNVGRCRERSPNREKTLVGG